MSEDFEQDLTDETIYEDRSRKQVELPALGSRGEHVELLEQDRDHLLYLIKGGGRNTGGIGCFALMWNLISWTIAVAFSLAFFNGGFRGKEEPPVFVFGIIALFPAIGIGFAYSWFYMKFGRSLLMVNRTMIGLQNDLFGWKKIRTLELNPSDRGKLTVAYSQNDVPVYQIEFSNNSGKITFGTGLGQDEKRELLDEIHRFLGVGSESVDGEMGESLRFAGSPEEARKVLEENGLEIEEEFPDQWLIRIIPRRTSKNFLMAVLFLTGFATFWEGFIVFWTYMAAQGSIFFALFSIPFHGVGLFLWGMILFLIFGRTEIRLSKQELSVRSSVFLFQKTSRAAFGDIQEFKILRRVGDENNGHAALVAKIQNAKDIRLNYATDHWTPAFATFLNGLSADLRRG